MNKNIFLLLIGFIIVFTACLYCKMKKENYSPYRGTSSCENKMKWKYHKQYDSGDYYKNHYYIYPTPTNYVKALYSGMRGNKM